MFVRKFEDYESILTLPPAFTETWMIGDDSVFVGKCRLLHPIDP